MTELSTGYYGSMRRDGEIGIRKGFKIPRPQGHVGSTPSPGTILFRLLRRIIDAGEFYRNNL